MSVQLDDWTLSSLSGAMDWAVLLPPGAAHMTSSTADLAHSYPALYTELTPTVITGSASASAAASPIVYACLSSIVRVEKVGPRQLRLRQQLGWPGSYRLLLLTASTEAACDDWWRALHRLTYNNSHDISFDTTHNSVLVEGTPMAAMEPNIYSDVGLLQQQQQQQQQDQKRNDDAVAESVLSMKAPNDAASSSAAPSATPPHPRNSDVAELKRILLSPSPHVVSSDTHASLRLPLQQQQQQQQPLFSPPPLPPPPKSQTSSPAAAEPPSAPTSSRTAPGTPLGAVSLSASTIGTTTTASAPGNAAAQQQPHPDHYHHPRRRTSEATQTTTPPVRPFRTVVAPVPDALAPEANTEQRESESEAERQQFPPRAAAASPATPLPPRSPRSSSSFNNVACASPPVEAPPPSRPAPPPAPAPSSWRAALALVPSAISATPSAAAVTSSDAALPYDWYEPIHIDTSAVPRARSSSSPLPTVARLAVTSPFSAAATRPLSWQGSLQRSVSPRTPRITYSSGGGAVLSTLHSPGFRRSSSSPVRHRDRSSTLKGHRSPHASTATPRRGRSRTPPVVSPLLAVIAKPHLFLKYPVQVPHRGGGGNSGSGEASVPTYVFVTTDEFCVVAVPARRFTECVNDAQLLSKGRGTPNRSSTLRGNSTAVSIAVRSYARAKEFFGERHCRAIRVADVDRVTCGNEEPLILLHTAQRERFRDPSKMICIVSHTHAFLMEATNSTEAEWYVRSWKKYLRAHRQQRSVSPHRTS